MSSKDKASASVSSESNDVKKKIVTKIVDFPVKKTNDLTLEKQAESSQRDQIVASENNLVISKKVRKEQLGFKDKKLPNVTSDVSNQARYHPTQDHNYSIKLHKSRPNEEKDQTIFKSKVPDLHTDNERNIEKFQGSKTESAASEKKENLLKKAGPTVARIINSKVASKNTSRNFTPSKTNCDQCNELLNSRLESLRDFLLSSFKCVHRYPLDEVITKSPSKTILVTFHHDKSLFKKVPRKITKKTSKKRSLKLKNSPIKQVPRKKKSKKMSKEWVEKKQKVLDKILSTKENKKEKVVDKDQCSQENFVSGTVVSHTATAQNELKVPKKFSRSGEN